MERTEGKIAKSGVTRQIIVRPEAELEVRQAFDWYEEQSEGLGFEFMRAIEACLTGITRNPFAFTVAKLRMSDALWSDVFHLLYFIWLMTMRLSSSRFSMSNVAR